MKAGIGDAIEEENIGFNRKRPESGNLSWR
jgi:hypothetical protein